MPGPAQLAAFIAMALRNDLWWAVDRIRDLTAQALTGNRIAHVGTLTRKGGVTMPIQSSVGFDELNLPPTGTLPPWSFMHARAMPIKGASHRGLQF